MLNVGAIGKMMVVYCLQLLALMLIVDIVHSEQPFGGKYILYYQINKW
jgi:hypothetical protein